MPKLEDATVAIVGLGLMGGSLAGALRGKCGEVVGVARRPATVEAAVGRRLIDRGTTDLAQGVCRVDIVVLATPVRTILGQLADVGPHLSQGCLVLDLGSTKAEIVAAMAQLPDHVQPLGGHPMCGKETAGLAAADPDLFRDRTFILSPLPRTTKATLDLGSALARAAGARPLVLDAVRQDSLVATLSHLPYLLACSLVASADATTSADPAAWEIVAGGFRDTSRVAGSEVTMMLDILLTNRAKVLEAVEVFQGQLRELSHLLASGDEAGLRARLDGIRAERLKMFP